MTSAPQKLAVHTNAIRSDGRFAREFTGRGADISPAFCLSGIPEGTVSLAVTLEDMSHPLFGTMFHWLAWNIPCTDFIDEAIPPGATNPSTGIVQGLAYGRHRYRGPKPPSGKTHGYRFTIYALDGFLQLPPHSLGRTLCKRIAPHTIDSVALAGHFES